jgi:hypothetical protein
MAAHHPQARHLSGADGCSWCRHQYVVAIAGVEESGEGEFWREYMVLAQAPRVGLAMAARESDSDTGSSGLHKTRELEHVAHGSICDDHEHRNTLQILLPATRTAFFPLFINICRR